MLPYLKRKLAGGSKCQGLPACKLQLFYSFQNKLIPEIGISHGKCAINVSFIVMSSIQLNLLEPQELV